MTPTAPLSAKTTARTERWSADAGNRDVARLDIPADALRERRFEIFCRFVVSNRGGRADATHGLRVLVNGALEWSRSVATHADDTDSLDLRFHRSVPVGQALRVVATGDVRFAQRASLTISAEEE